MNGERESGAGTSQGRAGERGRKKRSVADAERGGPHHDVT